MPQRSASGGGDRGTAPPDGGERRSAIKVGLAQIDSRLGDLDHNLAHHLEWIERARAERVDLLLFPELSLTGYRLLHLTPRVSIQPASSPLVARLRAAAPEMSVVVGCVEEDERGFLFNSALLLQGGEIAHTHRKLYLPTYGIFQEGRFFGEQQLFLAGMDDQLETYPEQRDASHLLHGGGRPGADPADAEIGQGLRIERSLQQRLGQRRR